MANYIVKNQEKCFEKLDIEYKHTCQIVNLLVTLSPYLIWNFGEEVPKPSKGGNPGLEFLVVYKTT